MNDEAKIRVIVSEMFSAISWAKDQAPDFDTFSAAVHSDAVVLPATRPASPTSIGAFVERMKSLHSSGSLVSFDEAATGMIVHVYGNIAVAIGGYVTVADGTHSKGVNGFLFARDEGEWRIIGMTWDNEKADWPIPDELA
jgi:hypothetical protein